jgi:hypothetical protein
VPSIVILDRQWDDSLTPQSGFYGDVGHCIKDIRRRHPQAFPWERWIRDSRFYGLLAEEQRVALGCDLEWLLVWGGPFTTSVAILVRKAPNEGEAK